MNNNSISLLHIDLIKYLAIFYLIILSNFLFYFFTCYQINFIIKNKVVQYGLGFFLFFFLVMFTDDADVTNYNPPIQKLIASIFYYILFLISTRLDIKIMLLVLFCIFVVFFLQKTKEYYVKLKKHKMSKFEREFDDSHYYWITLDYPIEIRLFKVNEKHFVYIDVLVQVLYYIVWLLLILGIIAYKGELTYYYKLKKISWIKLFTDTSICNLKNRKSFLFYLKTGLNLK